MIVCGPGIGTGDAAHQIVKTVLQKASVPVVLDADALNIIAEDTSVLLLAHTELVITPHLGEMSRLTGDSIAFIQTRLIDTADKFAGKFHVTCVLKDEHTVVATPHGRTYLNLSGNHGMATAGSGGCADRNHRITSDPEGRHRDCGRAWCLPSRTFRRYCIEKMWFSWYDGRRCL